MNIRALASGLTGLLVLLCCRIAAAGTGVLVPPEAVSTLKTGQAVELLVEYESADVERDAASLRRSLSLAHDDDRVLLVRETRYRARKSAVEQAVAGDSRRVQDFHLLPMESRRFPTLAGLLAWAADPRVTAINLPHRLYPVLVHSLPLIGQATAQADGFTGAGTTVAVIDSAITVTNSAFGCSAPGTPAGCKVVVDELVGSATGGSDTNHGTNVSAIVLGVAPGSQVAFFNAFSGTSASSTDVIAGINQAIALHTTWNIVAINMSLGDTSTNTTPCSSALTNPFVTPIANARAAGISVVAAAGNNAQTNSISNPACTPGVISVGAVYSTNWGGLSYPGLCTDSTTAADQVACFSNSASYLTMLAPGALITAAGIQEAGTSQASPHVAGAVAVLRAAAPADTLAQTQSRLTSTGVAVTDARNGLSFRRLDLAAAVAPLVPPPTGNSGDIPVLPDTLAALLGIALAGMAMRQRQATQVSETERSVRHAGRS